MKAITEHTDRQIGIVEYDIDMSLFLPALKQIRELGIYISIQDLSKLIDYKLTGEFPKEGCDFPKYTLLVPGKQLTA